MWAGEYAVLEGCPALVMAVDRRVWARGYTAPRLEPLFGALATECVERFGPESHQARLARATVVDSAALYDSESGQKLGLGSSAAVLVAAAARCLCDESGSFSLQEVLAVARATHQRFQGGGSGVDLLCVGHGGVVFADSSGVVESLSLPSGLAYSTVWTGVVADTPTLVAKVAAAGISPAKRAALDEIAMAAHDMAVGFRDAVAKSILDAVHRGREAVQALSSATGVDLEVEAHRTVAEVAEAMGGAAKPTGAGGGDVALAVFDDEDANQEFRRCLPDELTVLEVTLDPAGVRVEA